jgi:hypothetical protein
MCSNDEAAVERRYLDNFSWMVGEMTVTANNSGSPYGAAVVLPSRYENTLKVACDKCDAAIGEPCKWLITGYDGERPVSHPIRYIAAAKPVRDGYRLHVYLPQVQRWECHKSSTPVMRDHLRAIWRAAGYATAVEM